MIKFPLQIIGITETRERLNSGFKLNNNLDGYDLYTQQTKSAAGGVAIYANKSLNVSQRPDLSMMMMTLNPYVLSCCVYRHPSSLPARFLEYLETYLS